EVARSLGRVLGEIDVAHDKPEVPTELLAALLHLLLRPVQVARLVAGADASEDGVQMGVISRAVDALEAEVARPLLAHPRIGAQAVRPVDRRAAAEAGAG